MTDHNPYAAPETDVVKPSSDSNIEKIKAIPRFTTWAVVGLTIITLGIYGFYWIYSRSKILNRGLSTDEKIPAWIIIGSLASYILYFLISIGSAFVPELSAIGAIIFIVYFVLYIIWIYSFRGKVNMLTATQRKDKFWIGPILTFFINIYYFQYKINQIHDNT